MDFHNLSRKDEAVSQALRFCAKSGLVQTGEARLYNYDHTIIFLESDLVQGVMKFQNEQSGRGVSPRINNETNFNHYAQSITDIMDLPLKFPQPIVGPQLADGFAWAVFVRLNGHRLGDPWQLSVVGGFEQYFPALKKMLNFFDLVTDVPIELYDTYGTAGAVDALAAKMRRNSELAVGCGQISPLEISMLCQVVAEARDWIQFRLQHGDPVPWNLFDEGEKLGVIDSEWGGIRMRYYDLAYIYVKLYVCAKKPPLAKLWLYEMSRNFYGQPTFERDIFVPLAYVLVPELSERLVADDQQGFALAQELIGPIRSRSLLDLMI